MRPMPRSTDPHRLGGVYANVRDYGAKGDGVNDDTDAIQRAIDSRLHVLFPRGNLNATSGEIDPYVVLGTLKFRHDGQRCTFLSGAILELDSAAASVQISGASQTFTGLRIQVGTDSVTSHTAIPNPCLFIAGADGLLLEAPYVACGSQTTLVRIQNTEGITMQGGHIYGYGVTNIGLDIGSEVKSFSAVGLAVDNTGFGVVFNDTSEDISFVDCTIEQQTENMIEVRGQVRGLSIVGLHMESGGGTGLSAGRSAAYRFVVVQRGAGVYGGTFAACLFGNLNETGGLLARRVFLIDGDWVGVNVSGCTHNGQRRSDNWTDEDAVWEILGGATISQSCDMFNGWDHIVVATGPNADQLPVIGSHFGAVSLAARGIRVEASRVGFFGATPVAHSMKYTVGPDHSRALVAGRAYFVLSALLRDLAALGLIECDVLYAPPAA